MAQFFMKIKENKKPKIIVICGPTASGKSDLAVWLAKKIGGEVVSADSRQVYKGLDIGSGKITEKEMKGVPHHLLDVASPKKRFSVSDYQKLANKSIKKIILNNKIPIICGGTGFYIDAIVKNLILPEVPPNKVLRLKLETLSKEKLFLELQKLDPKRTKSIDKNNKVRLIRAIEIANALGKVPKLRNSAMYRTISFGISWPSEILKQRIEKRLLERIKMGMIDEAKKLHKNGMTFKRMNELGLEYRYLALYLQKKIPLRHFAKQSVRAIKSKGFDLAKDEMIGKLNTEIWHYAKRQMTWFKRDKNIRWVGVREKSKILKEVKKFLE